MINTFEFYKQRFVNIDNELVEVPSGLNNISPQQAYNLVSEYNLYFSLFCGAKASYKQDTDIYRIDNLKDLTEQLDKIKALNFPDKSTVYLYTDFIQNKEILLQKIRESHITLKNKNIPLTVTNLKKESKLEKTFVKEYISSLEKNQTKSLFDLEKEEHEGISPNGQREKSYDTYFQPTNTNMFTSLQAINKTVPNNQTINGLPENMGTQPKGREELNKGVSL